MGKEIENGCRLVLLREEGAVVRESGRAPLHPALRGAGTRAQQSMQPGPWVHL